MPDYVKKGRVFMRNQLRTNEYEGMFAETMNFVGYNGDIVNSYYVRPLGAGPFPDIVVIHHMPGWDELYREIALHAKNSQG
jgi:carboxymethylenebutenolidase